ncbi:unnamed protein product [Parnassius apollo]|uniref:(apollo) hypothetical protein n=1 Tax=Parnassius apollo TaxID=110799 RepID=A0A8S3XNI0_PARAO|nr:unnamed protein product [Parnassius apollo]
MLTRNFNQELPENFFENIRSYETRNTAPDTVAFEGTFKSLLIINFNSPHSLHANCEKDDAHTGSACTSGVRIVTRQYLFDLMKNENLLNLDAKLNFLKDKLLSCEGYNEDQIIPEGGLICFACWVHTRRTIQQQGIIAAPAVMNMNACVWCRRSLAQTRSHSIPEGPERTIITQTIYPREIPPGGLVCYACWVAARRNVEHATRVEDNRQGPSNLHQDSMCAWCRMSLHRRRTHVASGPVRDEVAARIYPNELPEHALLCSNCWTRAHENIEMEQEVVQFDIQPPSASITLDGFTHTTQTSTHCFVPACNNVERNRVPEYLRRIILKSEKIFVTENARVCNEHKCLYNWEFLDQHQFSNTFTKNEIESMLKLSIQDNEINQLDFNNMSSIDEGLFKFWTGITKDNFINILNVISPALTCKNQKIALGIYLVKARTGDSHERIASLFHLTKSSITRLLRVAKEALLSTVSYENVTTRQRNKIRASSLEPQDNTFEKTMEDNSLTILEDTRMSLPDLNIAEHKELRDEISFLKTQLASAHLEIDRLNLQVTDLQKRINDQQRKSQVLKQLIKEPAPRKLTPIKKSSDITLSERKKKQNKQSSPSTSTKPCPTQPVTNDVTSSKKITEQSSNNAKRKLCILSNRHYSGPLRKLQFLANSTAYNDTESNYQSSGTTGLDVDNIIDIGSDCVSLAHLNNAE